MTFITGLQISSHSRQLGLGLQVITTLYHPSVLRPQCPQVPAFHVLLRKPQRGPEPLTSPHSVSHFLPSPCPLFLLPHSNQSTQTSVRPGHGGREGEQRDGRRGKVEGGGRRRGTQGLGIKAHGSWRNEGPGLWEAKGEAWAWEGFLVTSICLALAPLPKPYLFVLLRTRTYRTDTPRLVT